jgi:hypothetical protein
LLKEIGRIAIDTTDQSTRRHDEDSETRTSHRLPVWAPRVRKSEIRQLYETDAQGIYDLDMINEVGYGLLARCESFITASLARKGELPCPECGRTVQKDEILCCSCGWTLSWEDYYRTVRHKQLIGAEPVLKQFREFVQAFPKARTPQQKMVLIDRLIHGFHWYIKFGPTRPVAVNLIRGRMRDMVAFLDQLSYSDQSTPGTQEILEEWHSRLDVHPDWYPSRQRALDDQQEREE